VGDDLEDDEAAQLDVVDAETLEKKNDLLEKFILNICSFVPCKLLVPYS
jgi:hypothetical protein